MKKWKNLADNPEYDSVKKELAAFIPKKERAPTPTKKNKEKEAVR